MKFVHKLVSYKIFFVLCAVFPLAIFPEQSSRTGSTHPSRESQQIFIAAQEGRIAVLQYLIEKQNVSPDIKSEENLTPLHYAAMSGNLAAIKYLVRRGADAQACSSEGAMPIHLAAMNGQTHVVKYFITKCSIHKNICCQQGQTPLHYAAYGGQLHTVKYLIRQKANITARNANGAMPIHMAAANGQTNILTYFIEENHIDTDIQDIELRTSLHYAAASGHLAASRYLVRRKAHITSQDINGMTPVHYAAMNNHTLILTYFIEENFVDKDIQDSKQYTPLHYAALKGHLAIIEYLRRKEANITSLSKEKAMPIHLAALNGKTLVLKYFIDGGHMDKNIPNPDGKTPLHYAAIGGHTSTVAYLMTQDVNLKAQTKRGETALLYAWTQEHSKVVYAISGLILRHNEHKMLIPRLESLPSNKMPEWKQLMCLQYIGELPFQLETSAREIAVHLGEKDVFFYHTSDNQSHATSLGFQKIGLSTKTILAGIAYTLNKSMFRQSIQKEPYSAYEKRFKTTLYHELCHIKANDTARYYKEKILGTEIAALTREMAAELGAMYYLYTIDKQASFILQIPDDEHPSQTEHWRYIAYLYAQLLDDPTIDFIIVEKLAELYYQEKTSGVSMVPDLILPIAKKLFEKKMLSKNDYVNVYMTLHPMPTAY